MPIEVGWKVRTNLPGSRKIPRILTLFMDVWGNFALMMSKFYQNLTKICPDFLYRPLQA